MDRLFLVALIFAAFGVLIKRHFDWSGAIKENIWLLVLVAFMLVSVLWSSIPNTSFIRWIREFQAVLMAFVVLSEPSPRQAMESTFRRTAYILIPFSILLIRYFPAYGRQYSRWSGDLQWIGVTMQKNGLGRLGLIVAFYLLWSLVNRWRGHRPAVNKYQTPAEMLVLGMTVLLLKGPGGSSFSATAIVALFFGLLVFLVLSIMRKRKLDIKAGTLMIIAAMIIVFGIATFFSGGSAAGSFAPLLGRNSTLTDRTAVWKALLPVAMQRPIEGSGYGGFWTPKTREAFYISEGHNGYLDVLLGLGFLGLLLVSIFLLSFCRKAHRVLSQDFEWGSLCICFLMMTVVHNITESSLQTFTTQLTATVVFLSVTSASIVRHGRDLEGARRDSNTAWNISAPNL